MAHVSGSAQLITSFDPVAPPTLPTSIDQAITEWRGLPEASQAEALLLLYEADTQRPRVLGHSAIAALAAR